MRSEGVLGGYGSTVHAALRPDDDGFTLLGDRLLCAVDLDDLDRQLDALDVDLDVRSVPQFERPPGFPSPPTPNCTVRNYRLVDENTGGPVTPRFELGSTDFGFHARSLDGDRLRWARSDSAG